MLESNLKKTSRWQQNSDKICIKLKFAKTIGLLFSCEDGGIAESYNLCRPDTCSGAKEGL